MRYLVLAVATFLAVAGCLENAGDAGPDGGDDNDAAAVQEPIERIDQGQQSGYEGAANLTIESAEDWQAFWASHQQHREPADERPEVNFETHRVVAVVLGDRPNGCYGVEITNVTTAGGTTQVNFTAFTPPSTGGCPEVITTPYDIVKIPAKDTTVTFEGTTQQMSPPQGGNAGSGGNETTSHSGSADAFTRIERGQQTGLEGPMEVVITSQEGWAEFWRNHTSNRMSDEEPPAVDFETHRVIAVVLEEKGNTCWGVGIRNVTTADGETRANYVVYEPGEGAVCGPAMTTPYDIVKTPARGTDVTFERDVQQGPPPE